MDLRTLLRDLYGIDQPQGCTEDEIDKIKNRFGSLPTVVENFWRTVGRTPRLNYVQDTWILPEHYDMWTWLAERDFLVLLNENQGCCQAGIRKEDLSLPDPPVYCFVNDQVQGLIASSVHAFLEAALLYEGVWQLEHSPEEFYWLTGEDLTVIQSKLTKRPAILKNWFEMELTFYSNRPNNLVVVMDVGDQYQCLYGGATQESYDALLEVMEGLGEAI